MTFHHALITIFIFLNIYQQIQTASIQQNNQKRLIQYDFNSHEYLLISTSTKIFCIKADIKQTVNYENNNIINGNLYFSNEPNKANEFEGLEVIYEESNSTYSWITDVYYDRIDNVIYANIYDSSLLKSDIVSFKYDERNEKWIKTILFPNQPNCLGITYNEVYKELYWTSGQTIMAGLLSIPTRPTRSLFSLNSTKRLLYLKYDRQNEAIYVSSLNNVFACFLLKTSTANNCHVLISNFESARGIYFDSATSYLYAADHKRKQIQKIKVGDDLQDQFSNNTWNSESTTLVLDSQSIAGLGDIFYLCLHKSTLLWTEFSGKVKSTNLNSNEPNYEILFTTNEYIYSVTVMDNSTIYDADDLDSIEKSDVDDYDDLKFKTDATTTTTIRTTATTTVTTTKPVVKSTIAIETTNLDPNDMVIETTVTKNIFNAVEKEPDTQITAELQSATNNTQVNLNRQKVVKLDQTPQESSSTNKKLIYVTENSGNSISVHSPFLIALYVISAMLGLSLIVNLAFVYITRLKRNSGKFILNSENNIDGEAGNEEKQNLRNETADMS